MPRNDEHNLAFAFDYSSQKRIIILKISFKKLLLPMNEAIFLDIKHC